MMCFRDKTFCGSDCTRKTCWRHFGAADRVAARAWWSHDPDNAPIAFAPLHEMRPDYQPPATTEES